MHSARSEETDDQPAAEDVVDDSVHLSGVVSVEERRDGGDEVGAGEDLVVGHQVAIDVQDLSRQPIDLLHGEPRRGHRHRAGSIEGSAQPFDAPPDRGQLRSPGGHQFVDSRVPLGRSGLPGRDLAGPVGVGVPGLGEVGRDLVGPLGEEVAHLDGDAGDAPMPQVP
jgi:hypothetical protein